MNQLPDVVRDSRGNQILRGSSIGKGGEGAVFEVKGRRDLALKLYWPAIAASRRDKIVAMAGAAWGRTNAAIVYPVDAIYTTTGAFAGFTMRRVSGHKPIHLLYSPASRKTEFTTASFPFLVRAALNAAKAVASVHATGCVIGDVNHSGFLVSPDATVALIDTDSFQVTAHGRRFLCQVGTPEFTPPELQTTNFSQTLRTHNQDSFGLAILIFHLLFLGRHPYSGRTQRKHDFPLTQAITEFKFAYSALAKGIRPPPNTLLLSDFTIDIATAFETAFGPAGPRNRPNPRAWIDALARLERSLKTCTSNPTHHHVLGRACPWCRLEKQSTGFTAFPAPPPPKHAPPQIAPVPFRPYVNPLEEYLKSHLIAAAQLPPVMPEHISILHSFRIMTAADVVSQLMTPVVRGPPSQWHPAITQIGFPAWNAIFEWTRSIERSFPARHP